MARKQSLSIVDYLDVLDPRKYMSDEDADLDEDRTEVTSASLEVYKFMFRLMEQWKFLPVEMRDGGIIKGAYMGELEDEQEAAEQVVKLIESRFGKGRKIKD